MTIDDLRRTMETHCKELNTLYSLEARGGPGMCSPSNARNSRGVSIAGAPYPRPCL